jgi:para-aminobenzoate synthetase component 1
VTAADHVQPLVVELPQPPSVMTAVRSLAGWRDLLLFDSALVQGALGRYSFLTADPLECVELTVPEFGHDPFGKFPLRLLECASEPLPGLPPFQGGWAGLMGYELGRCWERVPTAAYDEFRIPVLRAGWYDWVLAWDHAADRAWLVSQGWPERQPAARRDRAARRLRAVQDRLHAGPATLIEPLARPMRPLNELSPQWPVPRHDGLWSNFSGDAYRQAVERVIEYITAGDIFQANLAQRLLTPATCGPVDLYERLRQCNPAPMAGLYVTDGWAVLSASPERFLQMDGDAVTTRPIKGTRRRTVQPEADLFTRDDLRESEKDQAENVMIVDLLRNDLSRVCRPGSVRVPQLCGIETFATVQHLVSEVTGRLRPGVTPWEVFRAATPGGSITGAPKVRAMEIIAELEPTVRGPYTGSLFYVGAGGCADSNLLIRTFVMKDGWLQCGVGGGITARSNPRDEYEETWHKAAGMLRSLR